MKMFTGSEVLRKTVSILIIIALVLSYSVIAMASSLNELNEEGQDGQSDMEGLLDEESESKAEDPDNNIPEGNDDQESSANNEDTDKNQDSETIDNADNPNPVNEGDEEGKETPELLFEPTALLIDFPYDAEGKATVEDFLSCFPDEGFRNYITDYYLKNYDWEDSSTVILKDYIISKTTMFGYNTLTPYGVESLEGIELFSGLTTLSFTDSNYTMANPISSLDPVMKLTNLKQLIIHGGTITEIPDEIENLTGLENLTLNGHAIETVSGNIGKLNKLTTVYLNDNNISSLPDGFWNLFSQSPNVGPSLTLHPYSNGDCGATLTIYSSAYNVLSLAGNDLTAESLAEAHNMQNVGHLILSNNSLSGEFPANLGLLENLCILVVSNNDLTSMDAFFDVLDQTQAGNKVFFQLQAQYNSLTSLPESIGNFPYLGTLYVYNNNLSSLPQSLAGKDLKDLYFHNNHITDLSMLDLEHLYISAYGAHSQSTSLAALEITEGSKIIINIAEYIEENNIEKTFVNHESNMNSYAAFVGHSHDAIIGSDKYLRLAGSEYTITPFIEDEDGNLVPDLALVNENGVITYPANYAPEKIYINLGDYTGVYSARSTYNFDVTYEIPITYTTAGNNGGGNGGGGGSSGGGSSSSGGGNTTGGGSGDVNNDDDYFEVAEEDTPMAPPVAAEDSVEDLVVLDEEIPMAGGVPAMIMILIGLFAVITGAAILLRKKLN